MSVLDLEEAGERAVETAIAAWQRHLVEPPRTTGNAESRAFIDGIIRSEEGLNWPRCSAKQKEYRKDNDFQWCGAFACHAWRAAGLDGRIAFAYFASTYRLDCYGRYIRGIDDVATRTAYIAFPKPDTEPRRHLVLDEKSTAAQVTKWAPRPGDILMVTQPKWLPKYKEGSHIAIVEKWHPDTGIFDTIEGNANGFFPDGTIGQGVIRQHRKVGLALGDGRETWHARRLIRPSMHDLTGALA